jgi:hypothetical protein
LQRLKIEKCKLQIERALTLANGFGRELTAESAENAEQNHEIREIHERREVAKRWGNKMVRFLPNRKSKIITPYISVIFRPFFLNAQRPFLLPLAYTLLY